MNAAELTRVLELHAKWRRGEPDGSRAYLAGADLAGADLAGADLADANLAGADLADAYLADANLARANLARAYLAGADLARAYLAGAYLAGADLAGARNVPDGAPAADPGHPYQRATTRQERVKRYRERHPDVPVVERLDSRILEAVTSGGGVLDMGAWHTCETTHCRAGWAITLAGEPGRKLESERGPHVAGLMIYRASTGRSPHFFASNERAMEDIKRCAAEEQAEVSS